MTRKQESRLRGHPPAVQDSQVSVHSLCWSPAIPTGCWGAAGSWGWCQGAADSPDRGAGEVARGKNPAGPESHFLLLLQQAAGVTLNGAPVGPCASTGAATTSSSSSVAHRIMTLHLCSSGCWQHFNGSKMDILGCSDIFCNSHSFMNSTQNSISMNFTSLEDLPSINTSYTPNSHIPVVIWKNSLYKQLFFKNERKDMVLKYTVLSSVWYLWGVLAVRGLASYKTSGWGYLASLKKS